MARDVGRRGMFEPLDSSSDRWSVHTASGSSSLGELEYFMFR